jgi:hypothetical protein
MLLKSNSIFAVSVVDPLAAKFASLANGRSTVILHGEDGTRTVQDII